MKPIVMNDHNYSMRETWRTYELWTTGRMRKIIDVNTALYLKWREQVSREARLERAK